MATLLDVMPDVQFVPYHFDGGFADLIEGYEAIQLSTDDSNAFIAFLKESRWGYLIVHEYDLQGLSQRQDGTQLLTAICPLEDFIEMIREAGDGFDAALKIAQTWQNQPHCNEVCIVFVDAATSKPDPKWITPDHFDTHIWCAK